VRARDVRGRHVDLRGHVTGGLGLGRARRAQARASGARGQPRALLHDGAHARFWLDLRDAALRDALADERLQRAIGVIYRPESERWSHYFAVRACRLQFDVYVHLDETRALRPLEIEAGWSAGDPRRSIRPRCLRALGLAGRQQARCCI
jgi:hypothetical protein